MDAKSIWIPATQRIINSSTYKVMKKPNRKDFPANRNGRSRYEAALRRYNASVRKTNKESEAKRKGETPRPKIKDYPNREAYRQAVLKWNEKRKARTSKNKLSPRERKFGVDQKKRTLKIKKQVDKYVADRKGPINKDLTKDNRPKTEIKSKQNNNQQSQNKSSNNNKLKVKATTKGGPVKSGVEYARSKGDDLAGFRRQKDTRITKKLKKSGFTEDRLARLRKKNAAFQKAKKGGKKAMEEYRKKYPKRG